MKHAAPELAHTIGKAVGRIPSGVFIVTAGQGHQATAMMASWVQQASFSPLAMSVAMGKERAIIDVIKASGKFAVNVLAQNDHALMKKYARGAGIGPSAFDGVNARTGTHGMILNDALAWMECKIISVCDFGGDHELLIGEVIAGGAQREGDSFVHLRGNGFHY